MTVTEVPLMALDNAGLSVRDSPLPASGAPAQSGPSRTLHNHWSQCVRKGVADSGGRQWDGLGGSKRSTPVGEAK